MHLWTRLYIRFKCRYVGVDLYGNKYFIQKKASCISKKKRFVLYNGSVEASKVPSGWHAWLHYTADEPPYKNDTEEQFFEHKKLLKNHMPNLTGTPLAFNPISRTHTSQGALKNPDYTPWKPTY